MRRWYQLGKQHTALHLALAARRPPPEASSDPEAANAFESAAVRALCGFRDPAAELCVALAAVRDQVLGRSRVSWEEVLAGGGEEETEGQVQLSREAQATAEQGEVAQVGSHAEEPAGTEVGGTGVLPTTSGHTSKGLTAAGSKTADSLL